MREPKINTDIGNVIASVVNSEMVRRRATLALVNEIRLQFPYNLPPLTMKEFEQGTQWEEVQKYYEQADSVLRVVGETLRYATLRVQETAILELNEHDYPLADTP